MHDPKFEKEVQQKMEELVFSPSEAVWMNVERAVNGEKRRRTPVFWFYLSGMVAAAGLVYFLVGRHAPVSLPHHNGVAGTATAGAPQSSATAPVVSQKDINGSDKPSADNNSGNVAAASSGNAGNPANAGSTANASGNEGKGSGTENTGRKQVQIAGVNDKSQGSGGSDWYKPGTKTKKRGTGKNTDIGITAENNTSADNADAGGQDIAGYNGTTNRTAGNSQRSGGDNRRMSPGFVALVPMGDRKEIGAAFPSIPKKTIKAQTAAKDNALTPKPVQSSPKRNWEAGFAGGVGISSVNQTLFHHTTVNAPMALANSGTSVIGAAAPQKQSASKIKPDLSFWAGILVQRAITDRLTITAGLNLHYYSTKIETGDQVTQDSLANAASQSYFYASAPLAAQPAAPYYPVGNTKEYVNRYYFLELPVSIQWQLNHSRIMPLFWEGGAAISYLMSANSLYYDTHSGVYYKNGGGNNRVQVNVSTALLVGLPVLGSRLQVGPQIQYGLSPLLNDNTVGDGHLFYGGIKLVVLPGKSKK
jgi:hypothetical protein